MHPRLRRGVAACSLGIALLLPATVAAHAGLVSSTPADRETLAQPPTEIILTFTEATAEGSRFDVLDADDATVGSGLPDPADPTVMRGTLQGLGPGTYRIQWVTMSAIDGDPDRGTITFTVAEPTPPASATPGPTVIVTDNPTSLPSATPTAGPAPTGEGAGTGDATGDVLMPIAIVGLLIGGGLAYLLRRRGGA